MSRDAMMEKSNFLDDGDDFLEMPEEETPVSDANEGDADQGANDVGDGSDDKDTDTGIKVNGEVCGDVIVIIMGRFSVPLILWLS